MEINYGSVTPIYEQLVSEIRRMIESGELKSGDALPPVRRLAAQLDVAPNTIARAYQELANLDLVEGHRRRGSIVRGTTPLVTGQHVRIIKEPIVKLIREGKSRAEIEALFKHALKLIFD